MLHRLSFLSIVFAVCALLIATPAAASEAEGAAARPPNIIFVLADDLGWAELGCYGNTFNETPHLDRLASQGMRFTQAYASAPVCSPTRASLMTGLYPARVGITDYLDVRDERHLSPSYLTLNERLKEAGYVCGLVGKWHLTGDYDAARGSPARHGWDEVICSETRYIGPGSYFHPYKHLPGLPPRKPDAQTPEYLTDRLNAEAVDFIRRHKDRPFFLYLSHYAPHTDLAGRPEVQQRFATKPGAPTTKGNQNNPALAAMLWSIDEGIGQIIATLAELNLEQETVVIFTSDNGGESSVTSNAPLRAGKSHLYEGGIRVPLIVRSPQIVTAGTECKEPVATMDFYPTFAEVAEIEIDEEATLDGVSLVPLLKGQPELPRQTLFWHYPLDKPHFLGGRSSSAIRQGDLKLIEFHESGKLELYDLAQDPGEQNDLSGQMPQRAAEMRRVLDGLRRQTTTSTQ